MTPRCSFGIPSGGGRISSCPPRGAITPSHLLSSSCSARKSPAQAPAAMTTPLDAVRRRPREVRAPHTLPSSLRSSAATPSSKLHSNSPPDFLASDRHRLSSMNAALRPFSWASVSTNIPAPSAGTRSAGSSSISALGSSMCAFTPASSKQAVRAASSAASCELDASSKLPVRCHSASSQAPSPSWSSSHSSLLRAASCHIGEAGSRCASHR
mmetsp:Transcript_9880/g.25443  ORF Transcript_9880/g.25443 Transcript_9880/m.25443 type:complete len:212 (+) Transcript_9880:681-1316(+)